MAKAASTKSDLKTEMKTEKKTQKASFMKARKGIRYTPDPGTLAHLDLRAKATDPFQPSLPALVTEESFRGCGLVVTMTNRLQVGDVLRVKVGNGPVLRAEVRWRTELDSQVLRVGLMFLE